MYRVKVTDGPLEKDNIEYNENHDGCIVTGLFKSVDPLGALNESHIRIQFDFKNLSCLSSVLQTNGTDYQLGYTISVNSDGNIAWEFSCEDEHDFWAEIFLIKIENA